MKTVDLGKPGGSEMTNISSSMTSTRSYEAQGTRTSWPLALTIAGFDPSSGAGITADLKVFAAHGVYGMAAITGLTVQSTQGVRRSQAVEADLLQETLDCLAEDAKFDGVKIGMLAAAQNIKIIRGFLERSAPGHIVLDPILHSSSGALLSGQEDLNFWREELLPYVTWVTPNLRELSALIGKEVAVREDIPAAALRLRDQVEGRRLNVLVTGGHLPEPEDYVLTSQGEGFWMRGERIHTQSTHGTGCTFSSSLLCHLLRGLSPREAAEAAKNYVTEALRRAYPIGRGHGPLNHLFSLEDVRKS
jgi:hydroxymethylpyrimidine/phosphomethylpyrimidine kinase